VSLVLVFVEVLVKGGGPLLITLGLDVFFIILAHAPKRLLIKINPDEIPRVLGYTPLSVPTLHFVSQKRTPDWNRRPSKIS
jgi:hypothetical protein